jgi:RNA polymerase sigma-70 factor, ECF subfamily
MPHTVCSIAPTTSCRKVEPLIPLLHRLRSDEALMLAYASGDAAAFEILYRRHNDGLYSFLYRHCPRAAVVDDLAQETWMAVIDSAGRYQARAKFRTWLYTIAQRRSADFWRRRDNQHQRLQDEQEIESGDTGEEALEHALRAVGKLPREQKDALLLQEQGFSIADIAAITGDGEETVKSRLRYARNKLRDLLEEPA